MTLSGGVAAHRWPAWVVLVAFFVGTFAAGAIGAVASLSAPRFYQALTLPPWAPAPGLFGPVWSLLYVLMAVAAYLAYRAGAGGAILVYVAQLALNAAWTWLFFALHSGAAALVDIVVLLALIVALIVMFWRVRPLAAALLAPYACWVAFATALTWTVWMLNPGVL
jgi:tryptophan-rich sensory protein